MTLPSLSLISYIECCLMSNGEDVPAIDSDEWLARYIYYGRQFDQTEQFVRMPLFRIHIPTSQ